MSEGRSILATYWKNYILTYKVPNNLNVWYVFGSILLVLFFLQIISGIFLVMEYTPTAEGAFVSIQHIMRNVHYGWLIRFIHTTGASAFFVAIYLHMYRALIYGSYQKPREFVWLGGMFMYLLLLTQAFTGYVLPWGQLSYWAAVVITSLVGAIPFVGETLLVWLRGGFDVSSVTLHRFFALHVVAIPFLLSLFIFAHLTGLRQVGSNNPEGKPQETIPFHPYYTVRDLLGIAVFLLVFCFVVFFMPKLGGLLIEPNNSLLANPMQTPLHLSPVWYMSPFYAILLGIPSKGLGLCVMAAAIAILFILPWLDRSTVRSIRYKGIYSKLAMMVFVISFCGLGYLGCELASPLNTWLIRLLTLGYFGFFFFMPIYSAKEKIKVASK